MSEDLSALRAEIDEIDRALIALLERRLDVAVRVAAYKKSRGLVVLDAGREREKLASVAAACRPETAEGVSSVFESIMAASRARQTEWMERHDG